MIKISETRRLAASAKNSGIGVSIGLFSFKYILVVVRLPGSGKLCVPLQDLISGRAFFLRVKNLKHYRKLLCLGNSNGEGKGVAVGIPAEIVPCVRKLLYHGKISGLIGSFFPVLLQIITDSETVSVALAQPV